MRVVIDTNALLVIIPSRSNFHIAYDKLKNNYFELAVSTDILLEYEEQLKVRYHIEDSNSILINLLENRNVKQIIPDYKWQLISQDPDDNKFVDCAIAANADYIVTNDKHFNILKEISFPKVSIISLEEFIKLI